MLCQVDTSGWLSLRQTQTEPLRLLQQWHSLMSSRVHSWVTNYRTVGPPLFLKALLYNPVPYPPKKCRCQGGEGSLAWTSLSQTGLLPTQDRGELGSFIITAVLTVSHPRTHTHTQLKADRDFSLRLLSLSLSLTSAHRRRLLAVAAASCRTLPGCSPEWLCRRRVLASQSSKFTAVDAAVKRSNRHLLFLPLPRIPGAGEEGINRWSY